MIKPNFASMPTPELSAWWLENVGYEPLSEGWTPAELQQLCEEMFDCMQEAEEVSGE